MGNEPFPPFKNPFPVGNETFPVLLFRLKTGNDARRAGNDSRKTSPHRLVSL